MPPPSSLSLFLSLFLSLPLLTQTCLLLRAARSTFSSSPQPLSRGAAGSRSFSSPSPQSAGHAPKPPPGHMAFDTSQELLLDPDKMRPMRERVAQLSAAARGGSGRPMAARKPGRPGRVFRTVRCRIGAVRGGKCDVMSASGSCERQVPDIIAATSL